MNERAKITAKAVASGAAGEGLGARSGGSRKASFNCMNALLAAPTRRVGRPEASAHAYAQCSSPSLPRSWSIADFSAGVRSACSGLQSVHSAGMSDRLPSGKATRTSRTPPSDAADRGQRLGATEDPSKT